MSEVIWHDVECGGYTADLPLWEELAQQGGPILELGCGTGRVLVHLAHATGELVIGLDDDDSLVAEVWDRAAGSNGDAEIEDVRAFELHERFRLALAPMQLIQLLPERIDRICCLTCVAEHLLPGGRAAFAIVEEPPPVPDGALAPAAPDVRELDGWVYSSLPLEPVVTEGAIVVRRLRQTISPEGELKEELNEVRLRLLSAGMLEEEAAEVGLRPAGRRQIPATDAHVGSTVVLLESEH
jgi:SAM-dependent methyltransferase